MTATNRRLRNSQETLIPTPKQSGLIDRAESQTEGDTLVSRSPETVPRSGWADASRRLAAEGEDALVMPEFANEGDESLTLKSSS